MLMDELVLHSMCLANQFAIFSCISVTYGFAPNNAPQVAHIPRAEAARDLRRFAAVGPWPATGTAGSASLALGRRH